MSHQKRGYTKNVATAVLEDLRKNPNSSYADIAARTGILPKSVIDALCEMHKREIVSRTVVPGDRRKKLYSLAEPEFPGVLKGFLSGGAVLLAETQKPQENDPNLIQKMAQTIEKMAEVIREKDDLIQQLRARLAQESNKRVSETVRRAIAVYGD